MRPSKLKCNIYYLTSIIHDLPWQSLHKKMKFSIKDFFSKCEQMFSFLRFWSHLLKKSLIEIFLFLQSEYVATFILLACFMKFLTNFRIANYTENFQKVFKKTTRSYRGLSDMKINLCTNNLLSKY